MEIPRLLTRDREARLNAAVRANHVSVALLTPDQELSSTTTPLSAYWTASPGTDELSEAEHIMHPAVKYIR